MASTNHKEQLQHNWDKREFVEVVQLNVLQIVDFLNQFDKSVKFKLARLNEKLNKLERSLEYCEAAAKTTMLPPEQS